VSSSKNVQVYHPILKFWIKLDLAHPAKTFKFTILYHTEVLNKAEFSFIQQKKITYYIEVLNKA